MRLYVATLWACISLTCLVPLIPSTSKSETPDFDCFGFAFAANLSEEGMVRTPAPSIRRADGAEFPVNEDILNFEETLDAKGEPPAATLDKAIKFDGSENMKCVLLGAVLRGNFQGGKDIYIVPERESNKETYPKILLPIVFLFDDKDKAKNEKNMPKLDKWKTNGRYGKYGIGIKLVNTKKNAKELKLDDAIALLPDLFNKEPAPDKQHRVFISRSTLHKLVKRQRYEEYELENWEGDWSTQLKPNWLTQLERIAGHGNSFNSENVADVILIVCGPGPCENYLGNGVQPQISAGAQTTDGGSSLSDITGSLAAGTKKAAETSSAQMICSEVPTAPPKCRFAATKDDQSAEHRFTIVVEPSLFKRKGDKQVLGPEVLKKYGGLTCFFFAISPKFEVHEKTCKSSEFKKFPEEMLSASFEVVPGDKIVITRVARQPEVGVITVHPPIGFASGTCSIHANFTGANGYAHREELKLEPGGISSDNKHFRLDMSGKGFTVDKKTFSINLEVNSEKDCGIKSRMVTIDSASIERKSGAVTIDLRGQQMARRHVVYIPRFNDASYKQGGFSSDQNRSIIGKAMVGAIRIAHLRLAATPQDTSWRLDSATAVVFSKRKRDVLMRLDGLSKLKSTAVSGLFSTTPQKQGDSGLNVDLITQFSKTDSVSVLNEHDMFNAIRELVETGPRSDTDSGGPSMTLVLLGQMKEYSDAKDNVCDIDALKRKLNWLKPLFRQKELAESLSIVSFPLVIMKQGAAGDLADKVALTQYHSGNPEVLQGVVKCRNQTEDIAIYPLIARNWFDVEATAAWFATAVGDQLGAVLDELNTGS